MASSVLSWVIGAVPPGTEFSCAWKAQGLGFPCWVPTRETVRIHSRTKKKIRREAPLWSGYVFVFGAATNTRLLKRLAGFGSFIRADNGEVLQLERHTLEAIRFQAARVVSPSKDQTRQPSVSVGDGYVIGLCDRGISGRVTKVNGDRAVVETHFGAMRLTATINIGTQREAA